MPRGEEHITSRCKRRPPPPEPNRPHVPGIRDFSGGAENAPGSGARADATGGIEPSGNRSAGSEAESGWIGWMKSVRFFCCASRALVPARVDPITGIDRGSASELEPRACDLLARSEGLYCLDSAGALPLRSRPSHTVPDGSDRANAAGTTRKPVVRGAGADRAPPRRRRRSRVEHTRSVPHRMNEFAHAPKHSLDSVSRR